MSYYGPSSNESNSMNRGARRGVGRSGAPDHRRNSGNYSSGRHTHNPNHVTYPRGRGRSQNHRSSNRHHPYERRDYNSHPINNSSYYNHQHTNRNNRSYNFNRESYTATARNENSVDKKLPSISFKDTKQEESKPKINDTNWDEFRFEDKAKSQYCNDHNSHFDSKGLVSDDQIDTEWLERKKAAAKYAWEDVDKIITAMNDEHQKKVKAKIEELDSDVYDSDDSVIGDVAYGDVEGVKLGYFSVPNAYDDSNGVKSFIHALPYCIYIDQGLHSNQNSDSSCRCPCSKFMKGWKTNFNLTEAEICDNHKFKDLKAILQHTHDIYKNSTNFYHHGTELYLKELYKDQL